MSAVLAERSLGVGVGWRPQLALWIDRQPLRFVEVMAEDFWSRPVAPAVENLRERGATVAPHSVSLSLGGAEPVDIAAVERLGGLARRLGSPIVSDHAAFVRAGGRESGHLLPLPRTQEALDVLVENIRTARRHLPVPLAVENIATLFEWPGAEMDEATFLREAITRSGAMLLLDVANLHANALNHGWDSHAFLDGMPLDRLAYVHIAGGVEHDGFYHDTHAHPVPEGPLELLTDLCSRVEPPAVLLERDEGFPRTEETAEEYAAIARAVSRGNAIREGDRVR